MIEVEKLTGVIGAEIHGLDLSQPIAKEDADAVMEALYDNYVVFFRNQKPLSEEEHIRAGQAFGVLDISEIQPKPTAHREVLWMENEAPKGSGAGADYWHRDRTYLEEPPMGSMLQCMMKPDLGGDTCWASSVEAYNALSEPFQKLIDGLYALHSIRPLAARSPAVNKVLGDRINTWPTAVHPLVEVHPVTSAKALNVNANWTTEIQGVSREEGQLLLGFLLEHIKRPEFNVRFRWNVGDIAFWDNRTSLHCAIGDYNTKRIMKRVAFVGHKPRGPQDMQ